MKQLQQIILLFASAIFIMAIVSIIIKSSVTEIDPYLYHEVPYEEVAVVTATVYHATEKECDSDPNKTAFNYKIDLNHPDKHRFIAISRDLERTIIGKDTIINFKGGDVVSVEGTFVYDGLWIVADRLKKDKTNQIDFLIAEGQYEHKWDSCVVIKKISNQ